MLIIIGLCAFLASFISFYSGFGLGTILMPVMAIFFPVPIAIAITAIVHLLNNLFKFILLKKFVSWNVGLKLGIPAIIAAFIGSWLLSYLSLLDPIFKYKILNFTAVVEPVNIVAGSLLLVFATFELFKFFQNKNLSQNWLPVGGFLSGLFGGLSGQQGAFRTPFLLHAKLKKEQFIATNSLIAVLIDITRIFTYGLFFEHFTNEYVIPKFIAFTTIMAFLGAILGYRNIKAISFSSIRYIIALLLYILGTFLILGVI